VIGIAISNAIRQAVRDLDAAAGVSVEYRMAPAKDTGLPGSAFDVVTAGQSWYWSTVAGGGGKSRGFSRERGILVIAHFDWIPLHGNMARATEELIERHNSGWKLRRSLGVHPR
jgi:hypothetical protein